ncbi:MAG: hypothetical protein AAFQ88_03735 [Pseudomonadota bacterium]
MYRGIGLLMLALLAGCAGTGQQQTAAPGALSEGQTYLLAAVPAGDEATFRFCKRSGTRYVVVSRPAAALEEACMARDAIDLAATESAYSEDGGRRVEVPVTTLAGAGPEGTDMVMIPVPAGRFAHYVTLGDMPGGMAVSSGPVAAFDLSPGRVNLVGTLRQNDERLTLTPLPEAQVRGALEAAGQGTVSSRLVAAPLASVEARCEITAGGTFSRTIADCIYTELR